MRNIFLLFICLSAALALYGQSTKTTRKEYIERFKDVAIKEMERTGIPASITLAQGCLESDDGNSTLAQKANNHFGIKCHSSWQGKTLHQDDDTKNECFRVYNSAWESYRDHSDFLKNGKRYAFLFEYKATDYKAWAHGLKKAGYATNPKYPDLLIKIIEDNDLQLFDKNTGKSNPGNEKHPSKREKHQHTRTDVDQYTINANGREVKLNNRVKYIVAKKGDSFSKLAKELDLLSWELIKYNELSKDSTIREGQILYTQPKRNKADFGKDKHIVKEGETLYSISQAYAIKCKKLAMKNNLRPDSPIKAGDTLWLRKRKPPENK